MSIWQQLHPFGLTGHRRVRARGRKDHGGTAAQDRDDRISFTSCEPELVLVFDRDLSSHEFTPVALVGR